MRKVFRRRARLDEYALVGFYTTVWLDFRLCFRLGCIFESMVLVDLNLFEGSMHIDALPWDVCGSAGRRIIFCKGGSTGGVIFHRMSLGSYAFANECVRRV